MLIRGHRRPFSYHIQYLDLWLFIGDERARAQNGGRKNKLGRITPVGVHDERYLRDELSLYLIAEPIARGGSSY